MNITYLSVGLAASGTLADFLETAKDKNAGNDYHPKHDKHRVTIVDETSATCICKKEITVLYRYQLPDAIEAHYAKHRKKNGSQAE